MPKETYHTPNGLQPLATLIDMIKNPTEHKKVKQGDIIGLFKQLKDNLEIQAQIADFILQAPEGKYITIVIKHARKWKAKQDEQVGPVIEPAPTPIETPKKIWDENGALSKNTIFDLLRTSSDASIKIRITIRDERPNFWPTLSRIPHAKLLCDRATAVCLQKISLVNKEAWTWTADCKVVELELELAKDALARVELIVDRLYGFIADMDVLG